MGAGGRGDELLLLHLRLGRAENLVWGFLRVKIPDYDFGSFVRRIF